MKQNFSYRMLLVTVAMLSFFSCSKEKREIRIAYPDDITFEEQGLPEFSFRIPDAPFMVGNDQSGRITVNVKKNGDGTFSGFALSNKNWRSYPWNLSPDFAPAGGLTAAQKQASIDSTIFSVFTSKPNQTGSYLVASVKDEDAAITLEKPGVVEHILVANTTYNVLLESYGSAYSGTLDPKTQEYLMTGAKVKNILIANTSTTRYGRFSLPGPGGTNMIRLSGEENLVKAEAGHTAAEAARLAGKTEAVVKADSTKAAEGISKGYVKLTVKGFKAGAATGNVDYWLAIRPKVDPANPDLNYVQQDWFKVGLATLGTVDKLVFQLSSSTPVPPYFCLDGIRLRK